RDRLKIYWPKGRGGSTPSAGTRSFSTLLLAIPCEAARRRRPTRRLHVNVASSAAQRGVSMAGPRCCVAWPGLPRLPAGHDAAVSGCWGEGEIREARFL